MKYLDKLKHPFFPYQNSTSLFQSVFWDKFQSNMFGIKVYWIDSFLILEYDIIIYINGITKNQLTDNFVSLSKVITKLLNSEKRNKCLVLEFQILEDDNITPILNNFLVKYGLQPSPFYITPRKRCIVDLSNSLDNIRKNYYGKTQNDINRAKNRGVKVIKSWEIGEFYSLYSLTAQKQNFKPHSYSYFNTLIQLVKRNNNGELLFGKLNDNKIATALICWHNKTVYYLYTGSTMKYSRYNAPTLIQDFIIESSKKESLYIYDLMGVKTTKHNNTRFKLKFGTFTINLTKTYVANLY